MRLLSVPLAIATASLAVLLLRQPLGPLLGAVSLGQLLLLPLMLLLRLAAAVAACLVSFLLLLLLPQLLVLLGREASSVVLMLQGGPLVGPLLLAAICLGPPQGTPNIQVRSEAPFSAALLLGGPLPAGVCLGLLLGGAPRAALSSGAPMRDP